MIQPPQSGRTLGPVLPVTYSLNGRDGLRGTVQSVTVEHSDIFLPRIAHLFVQGETGRVAAPWGGKEYDEVKLSMWQLSEESRRAVAEAAGVPHAA